MKKFEVGNSYTMRSACDHNCAWTCTVIARTNSTITITDGKETKTCRVVKSLSEASETIRPFGNYSMCPLLRA